MGYSGISRNASDHAKEKILNIQTGKTESQLQEIVSLASEAVKSIGNQCSMQEIGELLAEGWRLKKSLSSGLSEKWLSDLIDKGLAAGAYGGKLMGAGGGGFFYFIAEPSQHDKIKKALSDIKVWVPMKFDWSGSRVIFNS